MATRRRDPAFTVYGPDHRKVRARAVAVYQPGQRCVIGGERLWCHPRWLDLAHDHVNGGYLGLSCRRHNRGEGAQRGNWIRGLLRHPERGVIMSGWQSSRDW